VNLHGVAVLLLEVPHLLWPEITLDILNVNLMTFDSVGILSGNFHSDKNQSMKYMPM
jgi:hypothetical protein